MSASGEDAMQVDDELFVLSEEFAGHSNMVRCCCSLSSGLLVTGSRDNTARLWAPLSSTGRDFIPIYTLQHENAVSSVCGLSPSALLPNGGVATASIDKIIRVYALPDEETVRKAVMTASANVTPPDLEPLLLLPGHEDNVCALDSSPDGLILISGSWDKAAFVWDLQTGTIRHTLQAHEMAVWAVAIVPSPSGYMYVTGAADKALIFWQELHQEDGSVSVSAVRVVQGAHTDVVRGIVSLPHLSLLYTTANDGVVKLWDMAGNLLNEFFASNSYLYSICALPTGEIAVCGEDCSVKIFRDGTIHQSIDHPGVVWDVKPVVQYLEHGEAVCSLLTACGDGNARLFARHPSLAAPPSVLSAFNEQLHQRQLSAENMASKGGMNWKSLPTEERLLTPGTHDGEQAYIREPGMQIAVYLWSAAEQKWNKLGYVQSQSGPAGASSEIDGVTYDHVFDVELDGTYYRLGHNNSDNPWESAMNFLRQNELPKHMWDQVARFLIENTKSQFVLEEAQASPSASSTTQQVPQTVPVREPPQAVPKTQGGNSKSRGRSIANEHFPFKNFVSYTQMGSVPKLKEKVLSINENFALSDDTTDLCFTDISSFMELVDVISDQRFYHSSTITDKMVRLFTRNMFNWPDSSLFPVFDLVRAMLVHPRGGAAFREHGVDLPGILLTRGMRPEAPVAVKILAYQALSNCFTVAEMQEYIQTHIKEDFIELLETMLGLSSVEKLGKALTPLCSVVVNVSLFLRRSLLDASFAKRLLVALIPLLSHPVISDELRYRLLASVGTLCDSEDELIAVCRERNLSGQLETLGASTDSRVSSCSKILLSLLQ